MRLRLPLLAAALLAGAGTARAADPDALWKIVHDHCVPNQTEHQSPAPCALVDLAAGYVVLKDLVGATQYLVMPTAKSAGIEDPALRAPGAPNYFADAWRSRNYTEKAAGRNLPRDGLSLAVNSAYARSQNQLHIHVDCVRADVREALARQQAAIGDKWRPLKEKLAGHFYRARRLRGEDIGADPFQLVALGIPGARGNMAAHTIVVVGADFAGKPGFILLDDSADLAAGHRAGGEELQDHACALARP